MEIATKKFSSFVLAFGCIAFLSVALFGISQIMMGMEKRSDGTMEGCIFDGGAEICAMNIMEHIAHWQSMLTAPAPQKALVFALLLLLVAVFTTITIFKRNLLLLSGHYTIHWRLYIRQNPNLFLFNHLRIAFARGILNPKIY